MPDDARISQETIRELWRRAVNLEPRESDRLHVPVLRNDLLALLVAASRANRDAAVVVVPGAPAPAAQPARRVPVRPARPPGGSGSRHGADPR